MLSFGSTVGFDENGNMIPETVALNDLTISLPTRTFILKKFTQLWSSSTRYGLFIVAQITITG